jgi:hypothetical protein
MADDRRRAADPTTPPDELASLAADPTLAGIVAGNPNTPWETLSVLAATYPRQFLENPVLPLMLLADPDLAAGMDISSLLILLRYVDIPLGLLYSAANHPDPRVHLTARAHIEIAGEAGEDWEEQAQRILFRWGSLQGSFYRVRIEDRFQTPGFVPRWLLSTCVRRDEEIYDTIRAVAALSPDLSLAEFDALINDTSVVVCCNAARNRFAPSEMLYHLAHSQSPQIRLAIAHNPATSPEALKVLARDSREDVRSALACHPRLPADLCRVLARDGREKVRRAVAANTHTPTDVLIALASDQYASVRCGVAEHPATPPAILKHVLLHDADWRVRYAALQNPHISADALQRLADEGAHHVQLGGVNVNIRTLAARNPHTPIYRLWEMEKDEHAFLATLAKNPLASEDVLRRLAADPDATVRLAAAENPELPFSALKTMLDDLNMLVRSAVARHPHVTRGMLDLLAEDAVPYVCRTVARNPRTPPDIRVKAALQQAGDENSELSFKFWLWMRSQPEMTTELSDAMLSQVRHRYPEVWLSELTLLASPFCSPNLLSKYSTAWDWSYRFAVARNPLATPEILSSLADDGHRLVRAAARFAIRARFIATLTGQWQTFICQLAQRAQGEV